MEDSPYKPSRSALAVGADEPAVDRDQFGTFAFDRAFALGWEGFQKNFGPAVGVYALLLLLLVVAYFSCVGLFLAVPHLLAGGALVGLHLARGHIQAEQIFLGFRRYGAVLAAVLLVGLAYLAVGSLFSFPLYYQYFSAFSSMDNSNPGSTESMQQFFQLLESGRIQGYNALSYVGSAVAAYLSARWMLAYPLIVERGYGPLEGLGRSWRVTSPYHGWLFLTVLISSILGSLGVMVCCVGIFVSFPLGMAIQGGAMLQLLGEDRGDSAAGAGPAARVPGAAVAEPAAEDASARNAGAANPTDAGTTPSTGDGPWQTPRSRSPDSTGGSPARDTDSNPYG